MLLIIGVPLLFIIWLLILEGVGNYASMKAAAKLKKESALSINT